MPEDNRRLWAAWVATQVGGDPVRQRTALDAALQTLAVGKSPTEAADAARRAAGAMAATGVVRCRFCGSTPAVPLTVYEHNGYVVMMTFKNVKGPFCRNCGLYVWRRMTDQTLLRGWLGVFSFFIAPLTALVNLVNLPKLSSLTAPEPGSGVHPPADPGASLFRRPGVYVYLGVIVFVLVAFGLPAVLR
ncbi:MAG TPA: hypothetical protein VJR46_02785 [Candidatus Dormibacteraeota bacterium]|nr:hypothetical protein [Candidatus Dormibacteraeota bacterium]